MPDDRRAAMEPCGWCQRMHRADSPVHAMFRRLQNAPEPPDGQHGPDYVFGYKVGYVAGYQAGLKERDERLIRESERRVNAGLLRDREARRALVESAIARMKDAL